MRDQAFAEQLLHPLGQPVRRILVQQRLSNADPEDFVAGRKQSTPLRVAFQAIENIQYLGGCRHLSR